MPLLSMETTLKEYEIVRTDLRNLRWRTIVLLLTSTFLVLFWFLELIRVPLRPFLYAWASIPLVLSAGAWSLWVTCPPTLVQG